MKFGDRIDIIALEKSGQHKAVDLVLAAVVGDARKNLEPEEARKYWISGPSIDDDIRKPQPWDWTMQEKSPPPDLNLSRRLLSGHEVLINNGEEWIPNSEPVSVRSLIESGGGFISPSGKCYAIGKMWHEKWLRQQLEQQNASIVNNPRFDATSDDERFPYKVLLQKYQWISYRFGKLMVLFEGESYVESHYNAKISDLTIEQTYVAREIKFLNDVNENKF
jgi:hypothetical protein